MTNISIRNSIVIPDVYTWLINLNAYRLSPVTPARGGRQYMSNEELHVLATRPRLVTNTGDRFTTS